MLLNTFYTKECKILVFKAIYGWINKLDASHMIKVINIIPWLLPFSGWLSVNTNTHVKELANDVVVALIWQLWLVILFTWVFCFRQATWKSQYITLWLGIFIEFKCYNIIWIVIGLSFVLFCWSRYEGSLCNCAPRSKLKHWMFYMQSHHQPQQHHWV